MNAGSFAARRVPQAGQRTFSLGRSMPAKATEESTC
jgi:hypothetical protein